MKNPSYYRNTILFISAWLFFHSSLLACNQKTITNQETGLFSSKIYSALERKGIDGLKEVIADSDISCDRTYCRQINQITRQLNLLKEKRYQDAQNLFKKKQEEFVSNFLHFTIKDQELL